MKKSLSIALITGSIALSNGDVVGGENNTEKDVQKTGTKTTLITTKENTLFILEKDAVPLREKTNDSSISIKEKIKTLLNTSLWKNTPKEEQKEVQENFKQIMGREPSLQELELLENPEIQDFLYKKLSEENNWSNGKILLSLLLGFAYGYAYRVQIKGQIYQGKRINQTSFKTFGTISGLMVLLNGFIPGSAVYLASFMLAFISVAIDKTNQKKGISFEDSLFNKFAKNIPLPVVRYTADGLPLMWNEEMEKATGYSHQEILTYHKEHGGDIMELLYKQENLKKVREYLSQIEKTGKGYVNIAFTMTTKSGEEKTFLWATLPDGQGGTMRVATELTDIGDIYRELENTKELLRKDTLTGAYNREALIKDLAELLSNTKRNTDPKNMIMVMLDIDNFKRFNDSYGHESGDVVLKKITDFIQANLRDGDKFYRLHGDEFIILLKSENFTKVIEKLNGVRQSFFEQEIVTKNEVVISGIGSSWGAIEFNTGAYRNATKIQSVIEDFQSQIDEYMYAVKYYRLIKDDLVKKGKIQESHLDKNGISKPLYDTENNFIGVMVYNQYGSFVLSKEEFNSIKEIK
ncbi:sensor domain-containing diguanylate cyclase, partial [Candidatus Gracilibacteria bacterium]|nr:sensor domain-containing diguanylate cyclase [Candidatus Gracilibacteria bacterium]